MPELKKTKDVLLKTKDSLLKTEDLLWKLKTVALFLMGRSRIRMFFLIRVIFHWGGQKEGVRGGMGENP